MRDPQDQIAELQVNNTKLTLENRRLRAALAASDVAIRSDRRAAVTRFHAEVCKVEDWLEPPRTERRDRKGAPRVDR